MVADDLPLRISLASSEFFGNSMTLNRKNHQFLFLDERWPSLSSHRLLHDFARSRARRPWRHSFFLESSRPATSQCDQHPLCFVFSTDFFKSFHIVSTLITLTIVDSLERTTPHGDICNYVSCLYSSSTGAHGWIPAAWRRRRGTLL